MELNTLIKALLAITSQCSVKDATLAVIMYIQGTLFNGKRKKLVKCPFGHLGEMSIGEMSVGEMSGFPAGHGVKPLITHSL